MYVDLLVSTGHTLITCHALMTSVGNRPFELSVFFEPATSQPFVTKSDSCAFLCDRLLSAMAFC